MLLQLLLLLSAIAFLLSMLANTARGRPTIPNKDGESTDEPKVVTLGPMQSLIMVFRLLCGQSVPNYELSQRMNKEWGNILMIRHPFTGQVQLSISDMPVAKSIMSSAAWSNKTPPNHYLVESLKSLGLLFGNGDCWKEGRKVTLRLLHQFGFFREQRMEKIIQFETAECVREFRTNVQLDAGTGSPVLKIHHNFQIYTLNILWQVMLGGRRFEQGDSTAQLLLSAMNDFNEDYNLSTTLLDLFPWLRHLPFTTFNKNMSRFARVYRDYFVKDVIEPRRKEGNYRTNPTDFMDHFLLEVDRRAGEKPCYLDDDNFMACMRDLIVGALDTTNAALEHGILHMCLQPEIQRKVQAEIDQVVGTARQPRYEDRKSMPYTQAVLWEILRSLTPVPMTVRCSLKDVQVQGERVPKDAGAGINLYAIHHSKEIWGDTEDFRPERFLNEKKELVNLDKLMPFGHGKRVCPGEFVAKVGLFLFFVSLLQNFTFQLSEEHGPPCLKNKIGLSHGPFPFYVKLIQRRR